MKKIIPVLLSCCFLCTLFCSCDKKTTSNDSSESESKVSSAESQGGDTADNSDPAVTSLPVTANTDIDPDRLNTDYESLKGKASELFKNYYDGIKECDYKKFLQIFPDFYLEALEEEWKDDNQTNGEFIKLMNETNESEYGEDYYSFAEITAILQLTDDSLETLRGMIKETFGKSINLEDAYSVYITQNTRGSLKKDSVEFSDFYMLIIDGKYYLYDSFYTDN